jgi:hypothetical protein
MNWNGVVLVGCVVLDSQALVIPRRHPLFECRARDVRKRGRSCLSAPSSRAKSTESQEREGAWGWDRGPIDEPSPQLPEVEPLESKSVAGSPIPLPVVATSKQIVSPTESPRLAKVNTVSIRLPVIFTL